MFFCDYFRSVKGLLKFSMDIKKKVDRNKGNWIKWNGKY